MTLAIPVTMKVTPQHLADLFCTVIESGYSRYWCAGIYAEPDDDVERFGGTSFGPWYSNPSYWDRTDFKVRVVEIDEGRDALSTHEITLDKLRASLVKLAQQRADLLARLVTDDDPLDGPSADAAFQLIVLGDVIYG